MNPKHYLPKYGEHYPPLQPCSLALGRRVGIASTNLKIHDDEILLFHNKIEPSTADVIAQQNTVTKADKEYALFTF